jgi:hypothetical protein
MALTKKVIKGCGACRLCVWACLWSIVAGITMFAKFCHHVGDNHLWYSVLYAVLLVAFAYQMIPSFHEHWNDQVFITEVADPPQRVRAVRPKDDTKCPNDGTILRDIPEREVLVCDHKDCNYQFHYEDGPPVSAIAKA